MHSLIRRAAVAASAAVVLLGPAAGVASAGTVMLNWSPTTSPGTYNFGTLNAGQTLSQAFTLTNSGSGSTSALTVKLTGSGAFSVTKDACTGVKLASKKSCSVTVQYAPTASGQTDSAILTATSSKPAATASLGLLGQTKASPALSTTQNPATGPVGTVLQDKAGLTGGSSPTGSILFTLYATADCSGTPVDSEKVPVSGNGSYATSTGYKTAAAGTYQWTAAYSGDANNNGAGTKCGDEPVTITPGLFWADHGSGQIWEASPDGTSAQPLITIPPQPGPAGVAVSGSNLYWANQGDGTIWQANLDGTNAHPLPAIPSQPDPFGVAFGPQ